MDPDSFEPEGGGVEMPSAIVAMGEKDGRFFVVLEDGRTVDMTDWLDGGGTVQ